MSKNIAIIGGGVTGLTAGRELAKQGHAITIFEKNNELGGLLGGFLINGTNLEMAYHHIFTGDRYIADLIDELGLKDKLSWNESSMSLYFKDKLYPFTSAFDLLKFSPLPFFDRLKLGLSSLYLTKLKKWEKFSAITAKDWMIKNCGKKIYETIWLPLLQGKFHDYSDKVSMAWLWARLYVRGATKTKGKELLGYMTGGWVELITALKKEFERSGVNIKLGAAVNEIKQIGDKINITLSDGSSHQFDKVIFTGPSAVFADLIKNNPGADEAYLKKLKSINYVGALCLVFSSKQSLSKYYWHNINNIDSPFLVFVQHTNLVDKSNYQGEHIYYLGTYAPHGHRVFSQADDVTYRTFFDYLKKIFPGFNEAEISQKKLFKFKYAQHVVETNYEKIIPEYATPIPNLYLANFSQIFPEDRGINFSVREGLKIAKIAVQQ